MYLDATLLSTLPDFTDADAIASWAGPMKERIAANKFGIEPLIAVPAPDASDAKSMQQFMLGMYLADQMSYPHPADQAEFSRLASVAQGFPVGFRLYFARLTDGDFVPVGYTGWYPIDETIFNKLHDAPQDIVHRGSMKPVPLIKDQESYIYLFNYSIIPQFHKSPQSGAMIRDLAQTLSNIPRKGMAAVTVSQSGKDVAIKFGMYNTGTMTHDGEAESVYAMR